MSIPSVPLSSLCEDETALISSVHLPKALSDRLASMGFITGTAVSCVRKKKGSLIAIRARGAVTALRLSDAALILVQK